MDTLWYLITVVLLIACAAGLAGIIQFIYVLPAWLLYGLLRLTWGVYDES